MMQLIHLYFVNEIMQYNTGKGLAFTDRVQRQVKDDSIIFMCFIVQSTIPGLTVLLNKEADKEALLLSTIELFKTLHTNTVQVITTCM